MNGEYFKLLETVDENEILFYYPKYRNDYNMVAAAVKVRGENLEYASDELKDDKTIVTLAVISDGDALRHASQRLKNDLSVAIFAVNRHYHAIIHVGDELLKDDEVFKYLFSFSRAVEYYRSSRKCDSKMIKRFISVDPNSYEFANDEIKLDHSYTKSVIERCGSVLQHVHSMFKDDDEMVIAAIKNDPLSIRYASDRLRNDLKIAEIALQNGNFEVLKYIHPSFSNNKPLILKSIGRLTTTLKYLGKTLKSDHDVIIAALKMNGNILKELDISLRDNIEIIKATTCSNAEPLHYYDLIPAKILVDNRFIEHLFSIRKFMPPVYTPHKLRKIHNLESWVKGHFGNQLPQYYNDYDTLINYL